MVDLVKELSETFGNKLTNASKNINNSKTKILAEISGQILKLRSELSHTLERVGKIEKQLQDIEGLREEVAKLKEKAERQDNISVVAELRIIGVPSDKHENLYTAFDRMCSAIDVSTPSVLAIFRMKNKVKDYGNQYIDGPVMVRLSSPYERKFFMRSLAAFRRKTAGTCSCRTLVLDRISLYT